MPRLLAIAGAAVILVAMTGCIQPKPPATPTPTASAAPVFASEEEALAAAEESYARYLAVADQILADGGIDPERLEDVATGSFLEAAVDGYVRFQSEGLRGTGSTQFRNMTVQSYYPESGNEGILAVYVCEDVTAVDVVDTNGQSVVPPGRPNTTTFQAVFDLGPDKQLLISSREAWSDAPC